MDCEFESHQAPNTRKFFLVCSVAQKPLFATKSESSCENSEMESLAALVAGIYLGLIVLSIANVVVAIITRRGKFKMWVGILMNTITGLAAFWAVGATFALGVIPLLGLVVGSIILTWPKRKTN